MSGWRQERASGTLPAQMIEVLGADAGIHDLTPSSEDGYGIVPTVDGLVVSDGSVGDGAMSDPPAALVFLKRFIEHRAESAA